MLLLLRILFEDDLKLDTISDLKMGELVFESNWFSLFEAMSAIEMMDPKMDAGMRCNNSG